MGGHDVSKMTDSQKLDAILAAVGEQGERLNRIETAVSDLGDRMTRVETALTRQGNQIDRIETRLNRLEDSAYRAGIGGSGLPIAAKSG